MIMVATSSVVAGHSARNVPWRVVRVVLRAALVVLCLLPVYGFATTQSALAARLSVLGLFAITMLRPADGLLLSAALVSLGFPLALVLHASGSMSEPLLLAFLGGWLLHEAVRPSPPTDAATRAVLRPALWLAAVVAASLLVLLSVEQVSQDYPWPFALGVLRHLATDYLMSGPADTIAPAAMMLEGIGVLVAAIVLCRGDRTLARRTIAMAGVGAAGAAALNLYRFAAFCVGRDLSWPALLDAGRRMRLSMAFPDFNAAGSYFAMMLLATVGLAASARGFARWRWIGTGVLVTAALGLTGSRAAVGGLVLGGLSVVAWLALRTGRLRRRTAAAVGLAIIMAASGAMLARDDRNRGLLATVQTRVDLNLAAVRAAIDYPVFGVGIGRYWWVSERYLSPVTRDILRAGSGDPSLTRENAHNNYLQLLAELGLCGAIPLLWLLVVLARRVTRVTTGGDGVFAGALAGMSAFLLTCLAGHPLLIGQVSAAFWLLLGVLAALALASPPSPPLPNARPGRASAARWLAAAGLACLAASVPLRAHQFIENEADLTLATIGLPTKWSFDAGLRYRPMIGRAQFYVAGQTCVLSMMLRVDAAESRASTEVEFRVDGRPVKRVQVVRDSWREARLSFIAVGGKRFRQIDMRTVPETNVTVRVGRPATFDCPPDPATKLGRPRN